MAHRALVAYRDGDGYHLHYAHRGDGVADRITVATPFGGRSDRSRTPYDEWIAEQFGLDPSGGYACPSRVDPRPLARHVDPEQVLAAIDPTVETLVVVGPEYESRTYAVCPLGVDGGEPLVLVGPTDDAPSIRRTLVDLKDRLGTVVDEGDRDAASVRQLLRRTLARWAPVRPLGDASFLRDWS